MPRRKGATSGQKRKNLVNDDSSTPTAKQKIAKGRPKSVPAPERPTSASPWGKCEEALKLCNELLIDLISKKYSEFAWPFYKPIDTKVLGMHDYYDKVEKPMSLGTIKYKVEHQKYICPQEFAEDVRLIFANCYKYYPPHHDIFAFAQRLHELFEKRFAKILDTSVVSLSSPCRDESISPDESPDTDDESRQLQNSLAMLSVKFRRIEHDLLTLIKHKKEAREASSSFQLPTLTDPDEVEDSFIYIPAACLDELTSKKPPLRLSPLGQSELQSADMHMAVSMLANIRTNDVEMPPSAGISSGRGRGSIRGRGRGRGSRGGGLAVRRPYGSGRGRGKRCSDEMFASAMGLDETEEFSKQLSAVSPNKLGESCQTWGKMELTSSASQNGCNDDNTQPMTLISISTSPKSSAKKAKAAMNFTKHTITKIEGVEGINAKNKNNKYNNSSSWNTKETTKSRAHAEHNEALQLQRKEKNLSETSSSEKSSSSSPSPSSKSSSSSDSSPSSTNGNNSDADDDDAERRNRKLWH